jgi:hypothetical protein
MKKDDVLKGNKVIKKQKPTVNRRIEGLPQSARKKTSKLVIYSPLKGQK